MPGAKLRGAQMNFRRSPETPEEIAAGRAWSPSRRTATVSLIKNVLKPAYITSQECSANIRADLDADLGTNWRYVNNGNVAIWYDTNQLTPIKTSIHMLPSPGTDPRRQVIMTVEQKSTGARWGLSASHFTIIEEDAGHWQNDQMQSCIDNIENQTDITNTILGADINNLGMETGPRAVARAGRLFDLRSKLAAPRIVNGGSSTYNGWVTALQDGSWPDEVFTGDSLQPYYGRIFPANGASDHEFLVVSAIQLN